MDMDITRYRARSQGRVLSFQRSLAGLLACGIALGFAMLPLQHVLADEARPQHPREKTYLKRTWGVEIVFVRQSAAGYMLEFRYKVLDAEKAMPLFERQSKPMLTHVESGARMIVPTPAKTGALRNSNAPLEGRTYWMFFANPGKFVDQGDLVNIEIGDFLVEGLVVE